MYTVDGNGSLDAKEVAQVFAKLGEKVSKNSIQDQINAWSRTDGLVGVGEFHRMVLDRDALPPTAAEE